MRKVLSVFVMFVIVFTANGFDLVSSSETTQKVLSNNIENTEEMINNNKENTYIEQEELVIERLAFFDRIERSKRGSLLLEFVSEAAVTNLIFNQKLADALQEKENKKTEAQEELEIVLSKKAEESNATGEERKDVVVEKKANTTTQSNSKSSNSNNKSSSTTSNNSSSNTSSGSSSSSSSSESKQEPKQESKAEPTPAPESTPDPEPVSSGSGPFDTSALNNGVLIVRYESNNNKRIRLMVEKGSSTYTYNITSNNVRIPLQMGNGTYNLTLLENTEGTSYKVLLRDTVNLNLSSQNRVFLQSVQNISWSSNTNAVKKARQLTNGVSSDSEKVRRIYEYIINNVEYDYAKANNVTPLYIPSVSSTFSSNSGICYDYAALFAAMLRSVNIPTKLVMGYAPNVTGYHAWNEVFINGKWVVIDTTVDAIYVQAGHSTKMEKNKSQFKVERIY